MLSSIALYAVLAQQPEMRLMRYPTIYGDTVVFTYGGDLWTADKDGGIARRLTTFAAVEQWPRFSPDGKWIAFTGSYDGNPDVYVIPAEGGEPKRLTFDSSAELVRGWTPDGKIAYTSNLNTPGAFTQGLKLISPKGGVPTVTNLTEVADITFSPDGSKVAFNRNSSHNFNWRRYRGGTQGRIVISDLNASSYKEIPSGKENRWQPMWVGNKIYYIGDKTKGTRNLWSYDVNTGKETQLTDLNNIDIKWPSTDGKTIVFEADGELMKYDIASGKTSKMVYRVSGDMNHARKRLYNYSNNISGFSISPSGNRILIEGRGEIFSVPARTGETRNIGGDSSSREWGGEWAPDGKTVAFISDKSGEDRIYTMPQMGGEWTELSIPKEHIITGFTWSPDSKSVTYTTIKNELYIYNLESKAVTKVFENKYTNAGIYDWSPDSNWIAYSNTEENLQNAIYLYDVKAKKSHKVTDGYYSDGQVAFDTSGKYLFFVSARTFNPGLGDFEVNLNMVNSQRVYAIPLSKDTPNPMLRQSDEEPAGQEQKPAAQTPSNSKEVKVDLEGMASRAIPLPYAPSNYGAIIGMNNGVIVSSGGGTWTMFDFGSRTVNTLIQGARAVTFNPSRTKFGFLVGNSVGIADVRPGVDPNSGRVNTSYMEATLDPRAEWRQMFWQAWRYERDRFYDKNMVGVNWTNVGKQYEKMLPYVAHRSDLNYVLGLMLGELGTGHAYVSGGDMGPGAQSIPTGMLGADYEQVGSVVKFKKIYRGLNFEEGRRGPLGDLGVDVKEGEYLLAIDGQPLNGRSPSELLVNKVNRQVTLTVGPGTTMANSRKVTVRPIADEGQLRYIEWVEANRKYVSEVTGGQVGYMHVPNTSFEGMIEFAKGYYSQIDKKAIIIDERFNGGGMIPTFFIELLQRKLMAGFRQRNGGDIFFPTAKLDVPQAMLINEYAGSGGDLFPYFFKQQKLGPLIGTRTWGGLVGITGNAPLTDGGGVTAPEFGIYDPFTGKWIAENTGVDPDINIDRTPADVAKGKDPQLDRAIQYLLEQIKKGKPAIKVPDFPKISG
jgi:tricorn protease